MRPHVAGVVIQFIRDSGEVNGIVITEQAVFPQPLRSRTQGDVLGVALHRGEPVPIRFQRQRDECGRRCFCRVRDVVLVLHQLFCVRKILHQFCDELRLLLGGRTVIRDDLHPLPRRDVLEISVGAFPTAALDVRTFDNQPCHASHSNSRSFCSMRSWPLVRLTAAMLLARSCRSTSSLTLRLCRRMDIAISISTACL